MDKAILVSVIIPVFNVRPYLIEALDSVIYQTYKNLEIILIDDGSNDGSGEICDEYAEKDGRIRVIHQENKGLSYAGNVGLDLMTGQKVVFLDSDDAYLPGFIESMVKAMAYEKIDLVLCKYLVCNSIKAMSEHGKGKNCPSIKHGCYDRISALQALADGRINHTVWNKMYNTRLWDNIRFPVTRTYEVIATTYQVINLCNTIYVLEEPLYLYRERPGSISRIFSKVFIEDRNWAYSCFEEFVYKNTPLLFTPEQLIRVRQSWFNGMIRQYALLFHNNQDEAQTFKDELRQKIIKNGKESGVGDFEYRSRIAYDMICLCPWLLRIVYPVYDVCRKLICYFLKDNC